jgi:hypothetical protein
MPLLAYWGDKNLSGGLDELLVFDISRGDEFEHGIPEQVRVLPIVETLKKSPPKLALGRGSLSDEFSPPRRVSKHFA